MPGTADNNPSKRDSELRDKAVDWILGRINYERAKTGTFSARDFKLDRMAELLRRLGNPQAAVPVVHIAGTKGKGSTATMTAAILKQAGYKTGLFTSPHIDRFEERMMVDGEQPAADVFVELFNQCRTVVEEMDRLDEPMPPTYFEIATAVAWLFFKKSNCDIVVLEVGLGGRLDSTNICEPEVCVITSISLDHTAVLGKTLDKIAFEKAGIIKQSIPVISGATGPEASKTILRISRERSSELWQLNAEIELDATDSKSISVRTPLNQWTDIVPAMPGKHQARNLALVLSVIDRLNETSKWKITHSDVQLGLQNVVCPVRIEVVETDPLVIVDAAHNEAACIALVQTLNEAYPQRPRTLICATTGGKEVESMLRVLLPEFDRVALTQYSGNPRFLKLEKLKTIAESIGHDQIECYPSIEETWLAVSKSDHGLICATGSFFLASEFRSLLHDDAKSSN